MTIHSAAPCGISIGKQMPESSEEHHVVGQVQPSSAIIVFDITSKRIVGCSNNVSEYSSISSINDAIGQAAADVIGSAPVHDLRNAETLETLHIRPEFLGAWDLGRGLVDTTAFRSENLAVVELVKSKSDVPTLVFVKDIARVNERISSGRTLTAMLNSVSRLLRILSGFDRLQVLAAKPDGQFEVIADSAGGLINPTIGQSAPKPFDSERSALAPIRLISDVAALPIDVVSQNSQMIDLALSMSTMPTRHRLDHLQSIGMQAEFVQPIRIDGVLWGAMLYQNRRPRMPSLRFRLVSSAVMDLLAATISRLS